MRVVTHNVWVGQEPAELREQLARLVAVTDWPEVVALQEATRLDGPIPGYRRFCASPVRHRDDASCVLLVRREGVRVIGKGAVRVGGPTWQGPHGLTHPARVYPAVQLLVGLERWRVLDVHRAPLRHINSAAWAAEHAALVQWAGPASSHRRPTVMAGDWQQRKVATPDGFSPLLDGIDGALVRNAWGTAMKLPDRFGSDAHRPVVLDLHKEPRQ